MGVNGSIEADTPFNEHFYGLVNFGNTCYVNSVLQALYFCRPFREKIIQYKIAYNQRTASLAGLENSNNNGGSGSNSSVGNSNDTNNNNLLTNSNLTTTNGGANNNNSSASLNNSSQNGGGAKSSNGTSNGGSSPPAESILKQEHLLNCLAELFYSIVTMKKKKGVVQPKKFISRLRKDNESFDNLFQQDAHEFLNYLLNTCADILKEEMKELRRLEELSRAAESSVGSSSKLSSKAHRALSAKAAAAAAALNGGIGGGPSQVGVANGSLFNRNSGSNGSNRSISSKNSATSKAVNQSDVADAAAQHHHNEAGGKGGSGSEGSAAASGAPNKQEEQLTWIHELFQGILVNETKCLNCETSSSKEENFLDLSVDVEQNTSISHCLQEFSNMEMLCGECKYYCETCRSKQEAEKRMRIKKLPKVLALHLKRFKFVGMLNKFKKLTYRVVFPFELRLFNTTEDCPNSDRIYDLVSFVVHCGMGLNRGHYISVVKSNGYWFLFDDEQVEKIEVSSFEEFYGLPQDTNKKSETSYILFYEARQT